MEDLFAGIPMACPLVLGMQTADRAVAEVWFERLAGVGVEGLVIKAADGRYRPGRRDWLKYKHHDSTEVIVGGVTGSLQRPQEVIVGHTTPLTAAAAAELAALLIAAGGEHPWPERLPAGWAGGLSGQGPPIDYVRVEPRVVVEVRVDVAAERGRWRHALRYLRPRPDLTPADVPLDLDLQP